MVRIPTLLSGIAYTVQDPAHPSTREAKGWVIGKVDGDLTKLYRWFLLKRGCKTIQSAWGQHITIINGDKTNYRFKSLPKKLHFQYSTEMLSNGHHFWLPVISPEMETLRKEAGIRYAPQLHLTIGYLTHEFPIWMSDYLIGNQNA